MKHFKQTILVTLVILSTLISVNAQDSPSIYNVQFSLDSLEGGMIDFSNFKNKKLLIVNVASKCGYTSQYADLQKLSKRYKDNLVVIGVPCNQFGRQEPGSSSEIAAFCKKNYGVDFLITEKINVKGDNQHKLYSWLTKEEQNGKKSSSVKWNFQKYLISEKGTFIEKFNSSTKPLSSDITDLL